MATEHSSIPIERSRAEAIYTDAMSRMYALVAMGIFTTAATIWAGDMLGIADWVLGFGVIGFLVFFGIAFGLLTVANKTVMAGRIELGTAVYLAFAGIWGLFLSPILMAYTTDSIALAFFLAGGLFVAMTIIGMTTKRDISKLGPILMIALFGAIVVMLVNLLLLGSSVLATLINVVLLPIFLGLTVWETKKMKELAGAGRGTRRREGRGAGGRPRQHRPLPQSHQPVPNHPEAPRNQALGRLLTNRRLIVRYPRPASPQRTLTPASPVVRKKTVPARSGHLRNSHRTLKWRLVVHGRCSAVEDYARRGACPPPKKLRQSNPAPRPCIEFQSRASLYQENQPASAGLDVFSKWDRRRPAYRDANQHIRAQFQAIRRHHR